MKKGIGSFFTDRVVWSKIILLLIMIILFQFIIVSPVHAAEDDEWYLGKLLKPFMNLLVALGDGVIGLCHSQIMGQPESLIRIDLQSKWWEKIVSFIRVALVAAVGFAVFGVAGAVAGALVGIMGPFGTGKMIDSFINTMTGKDRVRARASVYNKDFLPETLYLPIYNYSPEEIFEGKILLFNVDFFGKSKEIKVKTTDGANLSQSEVEQKAEQEQAKIQEKINKLNSEKGANVEQINKLKAENSKKDQYDNNCTTIPGYARDHVNEGREVSKIDKNANLSKINELNKRNKDIVKEIDELQKQQSDSGNWQVNYYYYLDENGKEVRTSKQDVGADLGKTISKWYVSIRDIAVVLMMIVLLYIAIRMLLSTVAGEKAKYKQMFKDWIVGMGILFTMHIIMIVAVTVTQSLTNMVSAILDENSFQSIIPNDADSKLKKFIEETDDPTLKQMLVDKNGKPVYNGETLTNNTDDVYLVYKSNLLGYARLRLQLATWGPEYIGFFIAFFILVLLTAYFTFIYLRRVLYMAFLTLIAPVVAVTYPIDKINDGSAQGFDKWFKEYIFNLLIQPLHLLLYYVLIGSAFELASSNIIYTLVAMGFMIPAEKLLRSFFGFEKASTPGVLGGVATGAITMGLIGKLAGGSKKAIGKGNSGGKGAAQSSSEGGSKIRFDKNDFDGNEEKLKGDGKLVDDLKEKRNEKKNQKSIINNPNSTAEERQNAEKEVKRLRKEQRDRLLNKDIAVRKVKAMNARGTQRLKNTIKRMPGNAVRYTGKLAGAAGLGALGLAAGITTGNMSNVGKYASTAAFAGSSLGGKILEAPAESIDNIKKLQVSKTEDQAYNETYNSKQFEQLAKREYIRDFKKSNKSKIIDELGTKENYDEMMNSKVIENCFANGVEDIDDIMNIYKVSKQDNSGREFREKVKDNITVSKLEKKMGGDLKTPKEKEWREYIMKKQNLNSDGADQMIKRVQSFHDMKKS